MPYKRLFSVFVFIFFVAFYLVQSVEAVAIPSFPACVNPQGSLKVSYSTGTHGIVGSTATYTGSDAVYTLSDDTLTQCFCADDGAGIQTNWWKAASLSEEEIQILKNQGWFFVPNGSLWGLTDDPYMANNSSYSCNGGTGGGGDILAASTSTGDVLGLATTGNIVTIYALAGFGFASLLLSFLLKKNS